MVSSATRVRNEPAMDPCWAALGSLVSALAIKFTEAVKAYEQIARQDSIRDPNAAQSKDGTGFSEMLRDATESAVSSLREGEALSLQAAAGTADINDVVMAVGKAEMTLQTVVTLRDRVIQAYQEILRMPI